MKKRIRRSFYTLVEILTVIVIAAILFGIGIPAFSTMIQGSNMTIAIRQLSSKMQAARAYAVSNRCKVALLLMEQENALDNPDHVLSAYRVCLVDGDSSPFTFQGWVEEENWKDLPKGILRTALPASAAEVKIEAATKDKLTDMVGIIGTPSATNIKIKALVFLPSGQLKQGQEITLCHGRTIGTGSTPKFNVIHTGGTNHKLTVNQYSGKVSVSVP